MGRDLSSARNILLLHSGGLGDLVLMQPFFSGLRAAYPKARITLLCRASLREAIRFYPRQPDEILPLKFNPYQFDDTSSMLLGMLHPLVEDLCARRPDVVIHGDFEPTWLNWLITAAAQAQHSVACTAVKRPRGLLNCLLDHFHLPVSEHEGPPAAVNLHELARYEQLAGYVGAKCIQEGSWKAPAEAMEAAGEMLRAWGLHSRRYVVCFPLSLPSLKRWPLENYEAALLSFTAETGLGVLLTGELGEEDELVATVARWRTAGLNARHFAGGPGDIPLLTALLAQARLYLGNDTGPTHLAQALRLPGVIAFGGGTWPAYCPWAAGTIGVVHSLPCFGCSWDCMFGHGVCAESIPVEQVLSALRRVYSHPPAEPAIRSVNLMDAKTRGLLADAATMYSEAQADRLHRLRRIQELTALAGGSFASRLRFVAEPLLGRAVRIFRARFSKR